ncbi:MAG: PKD domain-containing protein [Candidatus Aminicenantales bacterium]
MLRRVLGPGVGALLLLSTFSFAQTLGNNTLLYHSEDSVRWTQCAFSPDGTLWVVWVAGDTNEGSGGPIWLASYNGKTISTPVNVTDSTTVVGNRPNVTVSSKGHVVVTWGVFNTLSTYVRIRNPKTGAWGSIVEVSTGFGSDEPIALMDPNENLHVLFSSGTDGKVFARSLIGGVWESVATLSTNFGKQGALALAPNGTAYAVWIEKNGSSNYENYYASRTASSAWAAGETLTGVSGSSNHPWVAVGPNNVAVMVWQDITNPKHENGSEIRYARIGASHATVIDFAMQHFPRVAVDSANNIHVACQTGGGDSGTGLRYTNNVGGPWKPPQAIGGAHPKVPGLAADPFGNVAATQSSYVAAGGTDIWVYSLKPVAAVPAPAAEFTFSPKTGYPPLTVNFHATRAVGTDGSEVRYDWVFGDGGSAAGRNVSHVYQTAGTFKVRLTVIDNLYRTSQTIKTITVKATQPLAPVSLSATITMSSFWRRPEITFALFWTENPENVPEHVTGYAVYMKEGDGEYTRLLTVSPSTFSASFQFSDLKTARTFAVSTLGYGGTESPLAYFQ